MKAEVGHVLTVLRDCRVASRFLVLFADEKNVARPGAVTAVATSRGLQFLPWSEDDVDQRAGFGVFSVFGFSVFLVPLSFFLSFLVFPVVARGGAETEPPLGSAERW